MKDQISSKKRFIPFSEARKGRKSKKSKMKVYKLWRIRLVYIWRFQPRRLMR